MPRMPRRLLAALVARLLVACVCLGALGACGGKGAAAPKAENTLDLDADPLALLPGSTVVVASIDVRSLYDGAAVGQQIAALADRVVPLGADAGFDSKRDVDKVLVASYATTGADVAAIVSGRFDEAKIAAVTKARNGTPVTKTMYSGRATYSVGPAVYCVLTSKTLVAGTSDGVRRVLDKVATGRLDRAIPAWVLETLQTPGAEIAATGDFATQPLTAAAFGAIRLPWIKDLRVARVIGDLDKTGMNVAATLTFANADVASSAADGIRTMSTWAKLLGPILGGVSLPTPDLKTNAADLQCKVSLDNQTLGSLLGFADRFVPPPPPPPPIIP